MVITFDDTASRTADLVCLQDVKRWGVMALSRQQSVAEHSYNVMAITAELIERFNIRDGAGYDCMWWAMVHDAPECITGDIDGRFKRETPEVKPIIHTFEDRALPWYARARELSKKILVSATVKLADQLETLLYIQKFGIGPRARQVEQEQGRLVYSVRIPDMARALENRMDPMLVQRIVDDMVVRLKDETHNIQMRLDANR